MPDSNQIFPSNRTDVFDNISGFDASQLPDVDFNPPNEIGGDIGKDVQNGDPGNNLSGKAAIKDFFIKTQKARDSRTDFHSHPVILFAVNFMRKNTPIQSGGSDIRSSIYDGKVSNWQAAPSQLDYNPRSDSNDKSIPGLPQSLWTFINLNPIMWQDPVGLKLRAGAAALIMKCLYNCGDGNQGHIKMDAVNQDITSLNYLFDGIGDEVTVPLYVAYFRYAVIAGHFTYGSDAVKAYKAYLTSSAWRNNRRSAHGSGNWENPDLEMFTHFVKLAACGAGANDISNVFDTLTTTEPKLEPSWFPSITRSGWPSYRGWLSSGSFDFGDMNADGSKLNRYYYPPVAEGETTLSAPISLSMEFGEPRGYWASFSSGGSCFSGDTKVLMHDGSSRRIKDIKADDVVMGGSFLGNSSPKPTKVGFVSAPGRAGRALNSLKKAPGIAFTSTHPLVDRNGSSQARLVFVDPHSAMFLNPTWQSLPSVQILSEDLEEVISGASPGNDLVYDLVFESESPTSASLGPATYFLVDENGVNVEVASEAPVVEWFPYAMAFCAAFLSSLSSSDLETVRSILTDESYDGRTALSKVTSSLVEDVTSTTLNTLSLQELLAQHGPQNAQASADLIEILVSRLGRAINHEIEDGWMNPVLSESSTDAVSSLSLHTLTHLGLFTPTETIQADSFYVNIMALATGDCLSAQEVPAILEGLQTWKIHRNLLLGNLPAGTPIEISLKSAKRDVEYIGRATLVENVFSVIHLTTTARGSDDQAALEVRLRSVTGKGIAAKEEAWGPQEKLAFAQRLGLAFGKTLTTGK